MNLMRLIILGLFLSAFTSSAFAEGQFTVYTVNYPLAYFAERIGGEQVEVVFPAPADIDPAYWMPDQKTIAAYQKADLILLNGANYAKWVSKVSLPSGKMVNTSRKFRERYIETKDVSTHTHGSEGAHAHEALAFTTWLDLRLAKLQTEAVYKALARQQPESEVSFKNNYQTLADELDALDRQIREAVTTQDKRPLLGSHPVYDYLAAGYGLNLKSVHWEPNEAPLIGQWLELKSIRQAHKADVMLWEGKPMSQTVTVLESMGINSVVFDPCGNRPEQGDFMTVMQQNVDVLVKTFR